MKTGPAVSVSVGDGVVVGVGVLVLVLVGTAVSVGGGGWVAVGSGVTVFGGLGVKVAGRVDWTDSAICSPAAGLIKAWATASKSSFLGTGWTCQASQVSGASKIKIKPTI